MAQAVGKSIKDTSAQFDQCLWQAVSSSLLLGVATKQMAAHSIDNLRQSV